MSAGALRLLAVAALLGLSATAAGGEAWRHDALWDDGRAELCVYDVEWPRYGSLRRGEALLVLVKEPWNDDLDLKADDPERADFEVLKLNHQRNVRTGIYDYQQMASVFTRRSDGTLVKLAATSSEACGITTARLRDGRLRVESYFESAGDRELPWPAGAWPEDGLPATLRDLVDGPLPARLDVFPSLLDPRPEALATWPATVARRSAGRIAAPWGEVEAVELRLDGGPGGPRAFLFEAAAPHRLLRLRGPGGTDYRVRRCERLPYWEMTGAEGEAWRAAARREGGR